MDLHKLVSDGPIIGVVVEGTSFMLDEMIDKLVASEDWDLAGRMLVSGAEISARQLAKKLLDKEAYEPLAVGACLRRQPRRPGEGAQTAAAGASRRVFRDIDASDDDKGVPDYIRADLEELTKSADTARAGAMMRESVVDRDPIRQYIVDNIAPKMATSEQAMNAMVAIARASAWEETRRTAALKVANDTICVARLARDLRTDDIQEVSRMALLEKVAETFAREMGRHFQGFTDKKDAAAMKFIAEHHPDDRFKDSARQWAEAIEAGRA